MEVLVNRKIRSRSGGFRGFGESGRQCASGVGLATNARLILHKGLRVVLIKLALFVVASLAITVSAAESTPLEEARAAVALLTQVRQLQETFRCKSTSYVA